MTDSQPRSLPSLRTLHAFVWVARTQSATSAAQTLGVTPSAVSHLLKDLEEKLRIRLFDRSRGRFALTDEGRELYQDLARAFEDIEDSVRKVVGQRTELRISTVDTVAQFWLIPRLKRFQEFAPFVNLYISATTRVVDLDAEGLDAAIRWGRGRWANTQAEHIHRELLVPFAHPGLVTQLEKRTPQAIARLPLVHAQTLREDWNLWLESTGAEVEDPLKGTVVEGRGFAIQAALAGVGAIVIDPAFVSADVHAGRLVRLSNTAVKRKEGYWLVWSKDRIPRAPLRQFSAWLKAEFKNQDDTRGLDVIDLLGGRANDRADPPE